MPIRIEAVFPCDPFNVWQAKRVFSPDDPFGLSMMLSASGDLVGRRATAILSMVNPSGDPNGRQWYTLDMQRRPHGQTTIDWSVNWGPIGRFFGMWVTWSRYRDAIAHLGPSLGRTDGVYALRGSVTVDGTDEFDLSSPFAFHYRIRR